MSRRKLHKWSIDFSNYGKSKGEKALVQLNTELDKPIGILYFSTQSFLTRMSSSEKRQSFIILTVVFSAALQIEAELLKTFFASDRQ